MAEHMWTGAWALRYVIGFVALLLAGCWVAEVVHQRNEAEKKAVRLRARLDIVEWQLRVALGDRRPNRARVVALPPREGSGR